MSKLTALQKERLYQLVSIADAQGYITNQAAEFVQETLVVKITPDYIRRMKKSMRNDNS
jgi:hypothetical protein